MPASGYYDKYTRFVNERSGLDPVSVDQVRATLKAVKEIKPPEQPHDRRNLLTDLAAGDHRCTARSKRTGERCQRPAMLGGVVCFHHGGNAPQTRARAQQRLQQAADVLVQRLLSFAIDGKVADPVALMAIRDALDRAGMKPGVDIDVTLKPFQAVFEQMELGGSRSQFRGEEIEIEDEQYALPVGDDEAIDVEILDADEERWPLPEPSDDDDMGAQGFSEPSPSPFAPKTPPPESGLMSYEAALSAAAQYRRNAVSRRVQRALPPGRT